MASEKDICNMALRRLGQFAEMTSLTEDSDFAVLSQSAYPLVRDSLLERHAWNFATTRSRLAQISKPDCSWPYTYLVPQDCIRVLAIGETHDKEFTKKYLWQIEVEGDTQVVYTDCPNAVMKYIKRQTVTDLFSPMFTDALAWLLAVELAGPVVKGEQSIKVARSLLGQANLVLTQAVNSDANQHRSSRVHYTPDWMK